MLVYLCAWILFPYIGRVQPSPTQDLCFMWSTHCMWHRKRVLLRVRSFPIILDFKWFSLWRRRFHASQTPELTIHLSPSGDALDSLFPIMMEVTQMQYSISCSPFHEFLSFLALPEERSFLINERVDFSLDFSSRVISYLLPQYLQSILFLL